MLIAGTDQMAFFASYLRHLLMLLDIRAEVVASPSQEALGRLARIDEKTLVIGLSAGRPHPLDRAHDEARAPPQGADARDHRRDALRGRRARAHPPLLLVEQPRLRALAHALLSLIQALAYGVYARDAQQYDDAHQGVPTEVTTPPSRSDNEHFTSRSGARANLPCRGRGFGKRA